MKANKRRSPASAKNERFEARLTTSQKRRFEYAAQLRGTSLTDFAIQSIAEAADRVIESHEVWRLGEEDRKFFIETLLNPPEPGPRLLAAVKRHREWLERQC